MDLFGRITNRLHDAHNYLKSIKISGAPKSTPVLAPKPAPVLAPKPAPKSITGGGAKKHKNKRMATKKRKLTKKKKKTMKKRNYKSKYN